MSKPKSNNKLQNKVFRTMLISIILVTVIVVALSLFININAEKKSIDENLQNIAETVAQSLEVLEEFENGESHMKESLDTLKGSLLNIDVISVIGNDGVRKYHSNEKLINTKYDGTYPDFGKKSVYVTSDVGPSGTQRRAYAKIVGKDGETVGFVLAVMLNKNIYSIIYRTIFLYTISALIIIVCAFFSSRKLSIYIKNQLQGYEPDTFSQMFNVRESILEALDEGIAAVDKEENVLFMNIAGRKMLGLDEKWTGGRITEIDPKCSVRNVIDTNEKMLGITINPENESDIVMNAIPVEENGKITGALCIMHDRTEYTRMMEELSGVKYLVDSMRANNHDFVNKLHVILGLIQIGDNKRAAEYITNITSVQQEYIHNIMENIDEPSIAALLIGKYIRAVELNIHFSLQVGSKFRKDDINIIQGDLVTIIGNLLENAMDSLNDKDSYDKELSIGIFSEPGVLMITVDDTGQGMSEEVKRQIFDNGFSTKGKGRGTGLHLVNQLVNKYNGTITVDSALREGTSFVVEFTSERR